MFFDIIIQGKQVRYQRICIYVQIREMKYNKRIAYYIQQEYDVHLSKRVQNLSVMKYCIEYPLE